MCSEEASDVEEESNAAIQRELEQSLQASSTRYEELLTKRLFVGRAAQFWKRLLQNTDASKRFLDLQGNAKEFDLMRANLILI
jgi:hypothetical protein